MGRFYLVCLLLLETGVIHYVSRALGELVMKELSEHVKLINVFHNVNSALYTVTSIHHNGWDFTKSY